jgi:AcrR family transcriptional regulator
MTTEKGSRAEETKRRILQAAGELFAERGFQTVTMREIAKRAGCSHTAIYMHCKDKEELLHQLAVPPLEEFRSELQTLLEANPVGSVAALQQASFGWMRFSLQYRSIASVIVTMKSVRVDEPAPELKINQIRLEIFNLLSEVLVRSLPVGLTENQKLMCSRIYFYMLMGVLNTYIDSEENTAELLKRLTPILEESMNVMHAGMLQQYGEGNGK